MSLCQRAYSTSQAAAGASEYQKLLPGLCRSGTERGNSQELQMNRHEETSI